MSLFFDHNSTTPLEPEVLQTIRTVAEQFWKNPSNDYSEEARSQISQSRSVLARMLGVEPSDILFTSGGTEANHSVYYTFARLNLPTKPHIITTNTEHPSVIIPLKKLCSDGLIDLSVVPVSRETGVVHFEDIVQVLRPHQTVLVSVMLANNETGAISPIEQIVRGLRLWERTLQPESLPLRRVFFHSDIAQAVGKLPIDLGDLGVDYATVVGHKFYGPRIGCLFVRGLHTYVPETWEKPRHPPCGQDQVSDCVPCRTTPSGSDDVGGAAPFLPLFYGGGQERGFRAGTENTPMIAGLGKAAELVLQNLERYIDHMSSMRGYLEKRLREAFPAHGLVQACIFGRDRCTGLTKVNGSGEPETLRDRYHRLPNTVNVAFIGPTWLNSRLILARCPRLEASRGAACHSKSGQNEGSAVLRACGYTPDEANAAIRLSVGRWTTEQDIELAVEMLKKAVQELFRENGVALS